MQRSNAAAPTPADPTPAASMNPCECNTEMCQSVSLPSHAFPRQGASADELHTEAAIIPPHVGLAKQDPIKHGHGAQYLYRPLPIGSPYTYIYTPKPQSRIQSRVCVLVSPACADILWSHLHALTYCPGVTRHGYAANLVAISTLSVFLAEFSAMNLPSSCSLRPFRRPVPAATAALRIASF